MSFPHRIIPPLIGALSLGFAGCGAVDSPEAGESGENGSLAGRAGSALSGGFRRLASAASSPFGPDIPVVEVREEELRDLPSGHEKLLAYQARQQRAAREREFFGSGSMNFPEPELPQEGESADDASLGGGLLPPKDP
jgi:hypothetical protein